MIETENKSSVLEDSAKLITIERGDHGIDINLVLETLRRDLVVLVKGLTAEQADSVMHLVAERLHLDKELNLQAGLAQFLGHRHNIGKYFMSVNQRNDYQFITPHSEGSSFVGMQLAAFYCYENTTDGGTTILMNVDESSKAWTLLRERAVRGKVDRVLVRHEIVRAKALYQVNLPADVPRADDEILQERPTVIPGLTLLDVLAKPQKAYSAILDRNMNVYWDSIDSADLDSVAEFARLLRESGLLREPTGYFELSQLDPDADRRLWHSGARYADIFKCKITCKLMTGDLLIQNNMTWTHAASNWSPHSGTRRVAASFA